MLETLMRLMLPMPAARRALSKALSGVEPSALPAVPAALVTGAKCIRALLVAYERHPLSCRSSRFPLRLVVNFWLIVAAEPKNASEKLPSEASSSARNASAGAPAASSSVPPGGFGGAKIAFFPCKGKKLATQCRKIRRVENVPEKKLEEVGEEGKSASTGASPAARVVRLRRRGHQQSGHREGVHGGSGQAGPGHHRRCRLSRVQSVRHQRSRRHRRVAPGDPHVARVPLRRRRRLLLR